MRIKMPAVRIAQADLGEGEEEDVLTCGVCQKAFALADIVRFIQHKVKSCVNKENYLNCGEQSNGGGSGSGGESSELVRRPAPILGSAPSRSPDRCSTPKRRPRTPPTPPTPDPNLLIKQEHVDSSTPPHSSPDEGPCKKLRTDATSNTTNSEPSNYVCSTCKARMYSAWRLVQHVQNSHGMKIYVESAPSSSSSSGSSLTSSPGARHNSSSGSTSSASSSGPGPSTSSSSMVPTSLGLTSPLVDPHLPMHNPFAVSGLVRMPIEPPRQFPPTSLATSLFSRPSSHPDPFRMEQLVSERFRLGGLGLPPPQTFSDRPLVPPPPQRASAVPPPPASLPLSLEPQLDFYSQRLRQLAGTTSPGPTTSSPSSKKHSPPFTSPPPSYVPQTTPIVPNNNNNLSTSNNNLSSPPTSESTTIGDKTSDPQNDSVDLSTTAPLSSSTPPAKATDLSIDLSINSHENGDKIHPCEYCGKKFRHQSNLEVHKRSHTGEMPYKCSVCDHACSQSSKLKKHMKVHRQKKTSNTEEDGSNANPSGDQVSNAGSGDSVDEVEEEDDDVDEDEDEMDEEEDEEMDLEEDDDDDEDGEAPEDLTTKSTSSTPPNNTQPKSGGNNNGSPKPSSGNSKPPSSGSLVGELMDKFGLSNIQQYNDAYKQALQESVSHISKKDDLIHRSLMSDNNNIGLKSTLPLGRLDNGLIQKSAAMRFREEFAKLSGQQPLGLVGGPHNLFGTGNPFEHSFDTSKGLKMSSKESSYGRLSGDRDLYAGLWLPAMAVAHHRESMFGNGDSIPDILKGDKHKDSSHPGTSASLAAAAAAAAALNLGMPGQMKKESRRNDTCEYCGKVFKNCSNLTVHRRSHTGEKPYKCELCSYACAQSSKLTRHMKTHGRMGKDVYRCRFCEMPFSVPSTLEKHMRKCVVNQNIKVEHHLMPSVISTDDDSTSATKDST